jgi:hypothetical protein
VCRTTYHSDSNLCDVVNEKRTCEGLAAPQGVNAQIWCTGLNMVGSPKDEMSRKACEVCK